MMSLGINDGGAAAGHVVKKHICYVAPMIFPLLKERSESEITGGAEIQQLIIATALRDLGYRISFVTQDFGQGFKTEISGFTVYGAYEEKKGVPGLRFFYPRVYGFWKALEDSNPDVIYVRGAGYLVFLAAVFARLRGKVSVFATAHDSNVDDSIRKLPNKRDELLYRLGLRYVHKILVQSNFQKSLLKRRYRREGEIVRNGWPAPLEPVESNTISKKILWIAIMREIKRPSYFIALSQLVPEKEFIMVGSAHRGKEFLFEQALAASKRLTNLHVIGYKSLEEVDELLKDAMVLINTSAQEGFPNTFLQAWRMGVPVVSFIDPDGVIRREGLGEVVSSLEDIPQALDIIRKSYEFYRARCLDYFSKNHRVENIVERLTRTLFD